MATKRQVKVTGSLNSNNPNPFELAYKEIFDKLPRWKQLALAEDRAEGKTTSVTTQFVDDVSRAAEKYYESAKCWWIEVVYRRP